MIFFSDDHFEPERPLDESVPDDDLFEELDDSDEEEINEHFANW